MATLPNDPCLLAVTTRSGRVESRHYGQIAVCDAGGRLMRAWGDPETATFMRSSAKPFQAMTCLRHGTAIRFDWSDEELAVVCASHSAEPIHRATVRKVLAKAGLTVDALQCGPHPPISQEEQRLLVRAGRAPTRIFSNCSGKHAGMLACCRARGWPIDSYRAPDHPLQIKNVRTIARMSGMETGGVAHGIDGCGVPSFHIPVLAMATAFARLALPESLEPQDRDAALQVVGAMTGFPALIAGTGRFDTLLGDFAGKTLVTKGGAEGVACLGVVGRGIGVAIKTSDGSARCHPAVVCRLLSELVPELDWDRFETTANRPVTNTLGQAVGRIEAAF